MNAPSAQKQAPADGLPWLAALENPQTYPHPVGRLEILHTHLSVVALAGEFAYKLKKPVNYGFADFSTLDLRRGYCEEEVRLNRRTAPEIYLGVAPLARAEGGWRFEGRGPPVEFAVRMRRFATQDRLDRVAERGALTPVLLEDLARRIAEFHETACPADPHWSRSYPQRLKAAVEANFAHLPDTPGARRLSAAFETEHARRADLLALRASGGRVRECHGDLHLANICLWRGAPLPFDGIEFSTDLRTIDVLSDAAFLFMDLRARGHKHHAFLFLNRYLERTGDYAGLPAWPLFTAYRAHVRAKIEHLTARAPGVCREDGARHETQRASYLGLAETLLEPPRGGIVMMTGLPASGKSTVGLRIASAEGGIRVRSDVERKRLHRQEPHLERYGASTSRRVYQVLLEHARAIVAGGCTAVLDATYLRRAQRAAVLELADSLRVPVRIVFCEAPLAVLRERVRARMARGADASDANEEVLMQMARLWEPLSPEEEKLAVSSSTVEATAGKL